MGLNTTTVLNSCCIVHEATFWEEKKKHLVLARKPVVAFFPS